MRWPWISRKRYDTRVQELCEAVFKEETARTSAEIALAGVRKLAVERLYSLKRIEDELADECSKNEQLRAKEHHEFACLLRKLADLERAVKKGELPHLSRLLVSAECFIELEGYVRRNTDVWTMSRTGVDLERLRGIHVEVDDERHGSIVLSALKPESDQ